MTASTLICIPTINESQTIGDLIRSILDKQPEFSILVIDDNSSDGTAQIVERLGDKRASVLKRPAKLGFASAYLDGFRWGLNHGYHWITQMDADFSHNPKHLQDLLNVRGQYDFVVGSRYTTGGGVRNWALHRELLSRFANFYVAAWLSPALHDYTGGFTMWHRRVLEFLDLSKVQSKGYSFNVELKYAALKAGFRATEVPIIFEERREGQSKMSSNIITEAAYQIPRLRFIGLPAHTKAGSALRTI